MKAHFYNEFKVDTNVVLERFLKLKRDEKEVKYRVQFRLRSHVELATKMFDVHLVIALCLNIFIG